MPTHPSLDGLAWQGSTLLINDDEKVAAVRRKQLSASVAASVIKCPASMAVNRLLPRISDPFAPNELGVAAHAVLEALYNLPPAERVKEFVIAETERLADEQWSTGKLVDQTEETLAANAALRVDWTQRVTGMALGDFALEDPTTVNVYMNELKISDVLVGGIPFVGFLDRTDIIDTDAQGNVYEVNDYKGLALDTLLPTPSGWTTMGAVQVGDDILGTSSPVRVTEKSSVHNRPCFRITMSDGATVIADNVHLWNIGLLPKQYRNGIDYRTVNTDELVALFTAMTDTGRPRSVIIENNSIIELPHATLPLDPYILGSWLGDGTAKDSDITVGADDEADTIIELARRWPGEAHVKHNLERAATVKLRVSSPERCGAGHSKLTYSAGRWRCATCEPRLSRSKVAAVTGVNCAFGHTWNPNPSHPRRACLSCATERRHAGPNLPESGASLKDTLNSMGLLRNKHIPLTYLRASAEQRLELLRGLMDTDGSWNARRGRVVFVNTRRELIDGVSELVRSLGMTISVHRVDGQSAKGHWTLEFRPVDVNPFALPRKAQQVDRALDSDRKTLLATRRWVAAIEPVESVPTQCIQVDADDSLYLAGAEYLVTHNTGKYKPHNPRYGDDYGDQQRLYAAAMVEKLGRAPAGANLLYTAEGKRRAIDLSKPEMDKTIHGFQVAWKVMNHSADTKAFQAQPSALCAWCPLANSCPVAKITSEKAIAYAKTQPTKVELGIPTVAVRQVQPKKVALTGSSISNGAATAPVPLDAAPVRHTQPPRIDEPEEVPTHTEQKAGTPVSTTIPETARLYPTSEYAAMSVFSLTDLAAAHLETHGQAPAAASIEAFTRVLGGILERTTRSLFGTFSWEHGKTARMEFALKGALALHPAPFGKSAEEWATWQKGISMLVVTKARVALNLLDAEFGLVEYNHFIPVTVAA